MAYTRRTKQGDLPEQMQPEQPTRTESWMTSVDKLFEAHSPNYYTYNDKEFTRKCYICQAEFTSHLRLLKFCSPEHQQLFLSTVHNQYKPSALNG